MRNWINNRRNQVSIILVAIIIITASNFIIPVYEALSYYREKTISLEKQYQQLYGYSLHVKHHEKKSTTMQKKLAELEHRFSELQNPATLQRRFGDFQRECRLKVVMQEIKKHKASQELEKIHIQQTLDGKYNDQMRYLKIILSQENNILLERYDLDNQAPLTSNPRLTAHLVLALYLPSK